LTDRCPHCKRQMKRSSEANRRYWLLIHAIADKLKPQGQQYSAEVWHEYAKQRFLGADDVTLPNGKVMTRAKSSAELDKAAFAEYMTAVEEWALEHDVWLADIEDAA
jgi:hypothetical protein